MNTGNTYFFLSFFNSCNKHEAWITCKKSEIGQDGNTTCKEFPGLRQWIETFRCNCKSYSTSFLLYFKGKKLLVTCLLPQKSTETLSHVLLSWDLAQDHTNIESSYSRCEKLGIPAVSLKFYSTRQKGRTAEVLMILVQWLSSDWTSDMNLTKWEQLSPWLTSTS